MVRQILVQFFFSLIAIQFAWLGPSDANSQNLNEEFLSSKELSGYIFPDEGMDHFLFRRPASKFFSEQNFIATLNMPNRELRKFKAMSAMFGIYGMFLTIYQDSSEELLSRKIDRILNTERKNARQELWIREYNPKEFGKLTNSTDRIETISFEHCKFARQILNSYTNTVVFSVNSHEKGSSRAKCTILALYYSVGFGNFEKILANIMGRDNKIDEWNGHFFHLLRSLYSSESAFWKNCPVENSAMSKYDFNKECKF